MKLKRKEAIGFAALISVLNLTSSDKEEDMQNALAESEAEDLSEEEKETLLRKFIEQRFSYYSNHYLGTFLSEKLNGDIHIDDDEPPLIPCFCCGYKTLEHRGEYSICMVCFWEDDGNSSSDAFSTVNRMTLREGQLNFANYGAISESVLRYLDEDRMLKYLKV